MALNFGRENNNNSNSSSKNIDSNSSSKNLEVEFYTKYLGGHKAYPTTKGINTRIYIYPDGIGVGNPNLFIPYSQMTNIENMNDKKISALRVVGLGLIFLPLAIVGALWKQKKLYTVIEYHDGLDTQQVIFDFDDNVEKMQPLIYQRMLQAKIKK